MTVDGLWRLMAAAIYGIGEPEHGPLLPDSVLMNLEVHGGA